MPAEVGEEAPDFELAGATEGKLKLSSFRGEKNVVLVFYPFTFTGVCHGELCSIRDDPSAFETVSAQVIAISCDSPFAQRKWAEEEGYNFPVLADFWPHGEVSRAYGVFDENLGCARRGTFVIDKNGVIVAKFESAGIPTARTREEYEAALAKLT
jgi:peroxiredoxin